MRRTLDVLAVMFCVGLAALTVTHQVVDGDEALFAAVGQRMGALDLPVYQAGWEHKPSGIFYVYRWLMAPFSRESMLGPHLGVAVTWVGTALLLGLGARQLVGKDAFAPTVLIYALLRSFGEAKAGAANTEAFLQLPLVAAFWCFLSPWKDDRRSGFVGESGHAVYPQHDKS